MKKKLVLFLLALVLVSTQAFAYSLTRSLEERVTEAQSGDGYRRVTGTIGLDSSFPAAGESLLPSQLGMASFTMVVVGPGTPPGNFSGTNLPRRFGFDYTNNRVIVLTLGPNGTDISGPVTYDLAYLTSVPFMAIGPIS